MWCWHRIRESESGLCPACRTPYGEDPHQFTAVDVEVVLRDKKQKEVAAKRVRQKQAAANESNESEGAICPSAMEVPKDRKQLANMRVIRRNLVYAVGLPPGIASEETLRKPEYFGQYGRISKIVLNRMQATTSDARRASASAYVTFVHKEDTLACILALDGFYLENRNIRASYGTSKYCSAFIKNVRCNNPDCTYLHEMGASEDTFTKQEIQAGYVTSGRDVLARQQQIVQEQMRQGTQGSLPRKRVGGGGPSGSGKACASPTFPPPEFDEPAKPTPTVVPPPSGATRAVSVGSVAINPSSIAAKLGRATTTGSKSPTLSSIAAPSAKTTKLIPASAPSAKVPTVPPPPATAASVVAGMHVAPKVEAEPPHTTLTPLIPLKRTSKPSKAASVTANAASSTAAQNGKKGVTRNAGAGSIGIAAVAATSSSDVISDLSAAPIGGDIIGPSALKPYSSGSSLGAADLGGDPLPIESLGNSAVPSQSEPAVGCPGILGGEVFTGQLPSGRKPAIGSGKDKWSQNQFVGVDNPLVPNNDPILAGGGPSALWNGGGKSAPVGGSVIGSSLGSGPDGNQNSSSALASILGINLPTGSGSLHGRALWPGVQQHPSPVSQLNGSAVSVASGVNPMGGGSVIGGGSLNVGGSTLSVGSSVIGGVPIGGNRIPLGTTGAIGGGVGGGSTKNDVALLRSLLPNVRITSGGETLGAVGVGNGGGNWNAAPTAIGPGGLGGETWGQAATSRGSSSAVGSIGGHPFPTNHLQHLHHQPISSHHNARPQHQHHDPGIW